jgi:hypothetical protein
MKSIASYNWCKIVYDNTREADHKWKVAQRLRMDIPIVMGCSLFLMIRTVVSPIHFHMLSFN